MGRDIEINTERLHQEEKGKQHRLYSAAAPLAVCRPERSDDFDTHPDQVQGRDQQKQQQQDGKPGIHPVEAEQEIVLGTEKEDQGQLGEENRRTPENIQCTHPLSPLSVVR